MKIVILGASGRTGVKLVSQALDRGHIVTAVVRNINSLEARENLNIVVGDVFSKDDLANISIGHDAVLSTLGNNNVKLRIIERSHSAIVGAMKSNNIKRLITELSFGGAKRARIGWISGKLVNIKIGKVLVDQIKGAEFLEKSGLDWTIAYATVLTNGPLTKKYVVLDDSVKINILRDKISRADVAYFMLEAFEKNMYIEQCPIVSSR
jgi:putative NADH-flavin reductase